MTLQTSVGNVVLLLLASCFYAGTAAAQEPESTLTARQLFYTERSRPAKPKPASPKPKPAPVAPKGQEAPPDKAEATPKPERQAPYLGLRYSIVQVAKNGQTEEVNPEAEFREGDAIRLRVKPNESGYLYIVTQGSSGNWDVLFPSPGFREGSNAVSRMEELTVPYGDQTFAFDERPGSERLFIVLSEKPESDLDSLIYSLRGGEGGKKRLMASASVPQSGIDKLRSGLVSRDLRVERRPAAQSGKREEAVYVVNAATSKDSGRVIAEITLKHR